MSYPVIMQDDVDYVFAVFVSVYGRFHGRKFLKRPEFYVTASLKTGFIYDIYKTSKNEIADISYQTVYNPDIASVSIDEITKNRMLDMLNNVRQHILSTGKPLFEIYADYMDALLLAVPQELKPFYTGLSMPYPSREKSEIQQQILYMRQCMNQYHSYLQKAQELIYTIPELYIAIDKKSVNLDTKTGIPLVKSNVQHENAIFLFSDRLNAVQWAEHYKAVTDDQKYCLVGMVDPSVSVRYLLFKAAFAQHVTSAMVDEGQLRIPIRVNDLIDTGEKILGENRKVLQDTLNTAFRKFRLIENLS